MHNTFKRHSNPNPSLVIGKTVQSDHTTEAFRGVVDNRYKKLSLAGVSLAKSDIDISWLPAASETYDISANPKDYVLVDVPLVTVDIPNRNLQAFPFEELSYFDPLYGKVVYSSFHAKPCHQDHENKDPKKAKGVNFDVSMQYVQAYNVWKVRVLSGFDRSKDPQLVKQILNKERTSYSLGALCEAFLCSVCGAIDTNIKRCACGQKGTITKDGKLVYQLTAGVNFIENSSVTDPADITANGDDLWNVG